MNAPLLVLDTPTLYYRAFHALPDSIRDPHGMPINAVRGVLDTAAALIARVSTGRVIAAMDADWRPAFRTDVVPAYKAQRITDHAAGTEIPPDLDIQLPLLRTLLAHAGVPVAEVPGTEADDVIASVVAQTADPAVIVSSDRDLLSLLQPGRQVTLMRPRAGGVWETTACEDLPELHGVPDGDQYRQLAALRGDPADGLDGVPGIGEKTAARLLEGYGGLEQILAAAAAEDGRHGLTARRRTALLEHADAVRRSLAVMTCIEDLDVTAFISAAGQSPRAEELRDLADAHGLSRSAERLLSALQDVNG